MPRAVLNLIEPPTRQKPKKLLEQVRDAMHLKHYAYRTEETYLQWIKHYILFHGKRHPKDIGRIEIEAFLTETDNISVSETILRPSFRAFRSKFLTIATVSRMLSKKT